MNSLFDIFLLSYTYDHGEMPSPNEQQQVYEQHSYKWRELWLILEQCVRRTFNTLMQVAEAEKATPSCDVRDTCATLKYHVEYLCVLVSCYLLNEIKVFWRCYMVRTLCNAQWFPLDLNIWNNELFYRVLFILLSFIFFRSLEHLIPCFLNIISTHSLWSFSKSFSLKP